MLTPLNGGEPLRYDLVLTFKETNNEVQYEAMITCLRLANDKSAASLKFYYELKLVVTRSKARMRRKEKR